MKKEIAILIFTLGSLPVFSQQVSEVKVTSDINTYSGNCPVRITFKAIIYSKGKGSFKYKWLRSDNAIDNNNRFVTLGGTGVDVVTTTWDLGSPGMSYSGWQALEIISPVSFTSHRAGFSIKCSEGPADDPPKYARSQIPRCDSLPIGYNHISLPNLLMNPGFNITGSLGSPAVHSGSVFNLSAADKWTVWIDHEGSAPDSRAADGNILTEMVPSTRTGSDKMIHVKTTGGAQGIVQVFGDYNTGPPKIMASAWIYVVSGRVGMGVGNGGSTPTTVHTTVTGKWEFIQTCNGNSPANEIILYGKNAEFFVEDARVTIIR